jgi:hypothetical protein
LSSAEIGAKVTWREAILLTAVLLRDPSSWTQAARNEWQYPVSYEWIMTKQLIDLFAKANFKKPKPYPAPWPDPDINKIRPSQPQTREQVLEKLARMNPKENDG